MFNAAGLPAMLGQFFAPLFGAYAGGGAPQAPPAAGSPPPSPSPSADGGGEDAPRPSHSLSEPHLPRTVRGRGVNPEFYSASGRALDPKTVGALMRNQGREREAGWAAVANAPSSAAQSLLLDRQRDDERARLLAALQSFPGLFQR